MNANHRLLIADDDEDLADLVALRFSRIGLSVTCCHDAGACLDVLDRAAHDAALIDGNLPGGRGLQLVAALRQMQPDLPILVFSGNDEASFIEEAYRAGAVRYLLKPCSLGDVQSAVFEVLREQRQQRQAAAETGAACLAGRQ